MAWRRIEAGVEASRVNLWVEGQPFRARAGDTVAAALLEAGLTVFRNTPVSGSPRGPLCLMGVCFDCLVQVDGRPNVQACMTLVTEGMQVRLQQGARRFEAE